MPKLTVLFADIAQSTALFDKYGDDEARSAISSVLDTLIEISEKHNGILIKTIGDEIMCTFQNANDAICAAVGMQESVAGNFVLGSHPIDIRIGFHHGNVIAEDGDVYGDTVNVAARMAGFAKKGQIITNSASFKENNENCTVRYRSLGKTKVKGKLLAVKIIEIFWQKDESQVTRVATVLDLNLPEPDFSMQLEINGKTITMTENSPNKIIGRGEECDIQILASMASRLHAEIQFSDGNFKIVDQSTNGTWLEIGGNSLRLHRDKTILLGSGRIALGSADFTDPEMVIYFNL